MTEMSMTPVKDAHPPPHAQCVVVRQLRVFTATPCYGMHEPWWVVRTMAAQYPQCEAEPVAMLETDMWMLLTDALASVSPPEGVPQETTTALDAKCARCQHPSWCHRPRRHGGQWCSGYVPAPEGAAKFCDCATFIPPSAGADPPRCDGRYPVPQTSPPRDEPFDVTYRCALPMDHDGPHGADPPPAPGSETPRGTVDGILYCFGGCGTRYVGSRDVSLPTPLWNRIAVGAPFDETQPNIEREGRGGVLCPACIVKRLAALPDCTVICMDIDWDAHQQLLALEAEVEKWRGSAAGYGSDMVEWKIRAEAAEQRLAEVADPPPATPEEPNG